MSYTKLKIWQMASGLSVQIHVMSLKELPSFELYEEGNQIRRSIKSVRSNIVEGYGRRRYKRDYIRFLIYALASNDETIDHLETLFATKSLNDFSKYNELKSNLIILGKSINNFIKTVELKHNLHY